MKFLIVALLSLSAFAAFASPASRQHCVGTDSVTGQRAEFAIIAADYGYGVGYTRNEVEVLRIGRERLRNNVFDMDTRGFPTCRWNSSKRLTNLRNGQTRFVATCAGEHLYNITAKCRFVF